MSYLENRRRRLQAMLDDVRADPWLRYTREELVEVLGVDAMGPLLVLAKQKRTQQLARMAAMGITYWGQGEQNVLAYRDAYETACRQARLAAAKLPKQDALVERLSEERSGPDPEPTVYRRYLEAKRKADWTRTYIDEQLISIQGKWNALTEHERRFFTKPPANPLSVFDMPRPGSSSFAAFPNERSAAQQALIEILENELAALDKP